MPEVEHLGRAGPALAAQHGHAALDGVRAQLGAAGDQLGQLVEQAGHQRGLLRRPGDGDLVAAHVDVGIERLLDDAEQLIAGAEQADHRVVVRDHDLDLGAPAPLSAAAWRAASASGPAVSRRYPWSIRAICLSMTLPCPGVCPCWHCGHVNAPEAAPYPAGHADQPGGQVIGRPPRTWACACKTVWPGVRAGVEDHPVTRIGDALVPRPPDRAWAAISSSRPVAGRGQLRPGGQVLRGMTST